MIQHQQVLLNSLSPLAYFATLPNPKKSIQTMIFNWTKALSAKTPTNSEPEGKLPPAAV